MKTLETNSIVGEIYKMCEWIMRLAYIQFLWIIFSLIGGIFLGIFPATSAMYEVSRKWMKGDMDVPVFKSFWNQYRKDFLKINILGWIMVIIGFVLYFYLIWGQGLIGYVSLLFYFLFFLTAVAYIMCVIFIFPIFVNFELKLFQYLKYSLLFALSSPLHVFKMGIIFIFFIYLLKWMPGLLPFLSVGLICFTNLRITNQGLKKFVDNKNKELFN